MHSLKNNIIFSWPCYHTATMSAVYMELMYRDGCVRVAINLIFDVLFILDLK